MYNLECFYTPQHLTTLNYFTPTILFPISPFHNDHANLVFTIVVNFSRIVMARNWIGLACPIRHNSNPSNFRLISSICLFLGMVSPLRFSATDLQLAFYFWLCGRFGLILPMDLSNYGSLVSISSLSYFIANATSYFEVQKLNEQEYLDVLTFHIRESRNLVVELLCIVSKACGCHKAAMQANCPLLLLCKYKHQHK